MYTLIKDNNTNIVYVRFPVRQWQSPTGGLPLPLDEKTQWIVDHKIDFGFINGLVVGAYLTDQDAVIFKLKFG